MLCRWHRKAAATKNPFPNHAMASSNSRNSSWTAGTDETVAELAVLQACEEQSPKPSPIQWTASGATLQTDANRALSSRWLRGVCPPGTDAMQSRMLVDCRTDQSLRPATKALIWEPRAQMVSHIHLNSIPIAKALKPKGANSSTTTRRRGENTPRF